MANFPDILSNLSLGIDPGRAWIYALVLAGLLVLVWAVDLRTRLRMPRWQKAAMGALMSALVILLVLSLVQVMKTHYRRALSVVFLTDVSGSIPDQEIERAGRLLQQAERIKGEAHMETISFASSTEVLQPGQSPVRSGDRPETNIQRALHLAYDSSPPGYAARIAVLTDGNQTRGDLISEAKLAVDRGIPVSVIPLQTRAVTDAMLASVNLPRRARIGERIQVSVKVVSNFHAPSVVSLLRGERTVASRKLDLTPGENWVEFELEARGRGTVRYSAVCRAEGDKEPENDALSAQMEVISRPRILLMTADISRDGPLLDALESNRIRVQSAPPEAFPQSAVELNYFDLVILSDPDPAHYGAGRVETLRKYVGDYGGSLLVTGGEQAGILGKEDLLPLEELLPVHFKEKKKTEPNPVALILVIDKSNSMGRENKFGMAVRAAKEVVDMLSENSSIGIIVFDDFPHWAVPVIQAKEKEAIKAKLDVLGVDGGTSIYPALDEAYRVIRKLENRIRHIVLLSDGFSTTRYRQNARLLEEMQKKEITCSTVALGKESDRAHLRTIAREGKGRFYYTEDINSIPQIFIEETKRITRTTVVEKQFKPEVVKEGEFLRGVDLSGMPEIGGYNPSNPRASSETFVLVEEEEEPLLTSWRYGLGRAVVFTSDAGGPWTSDWLGWDRFGAFWTALVRGAMRDRNFQVFRVGAEVVDENVRVNVDATDTRGNFLNNLDLTMAVSDPSDAESTHSLSQERPGGYAGEFPLSGYGSYTIRVSPRSIDGASSEATSRINVAPPSEYLSVKPNERLMREVVEMTGGSYDPPLEELFDMESRNFPEKRPLWPYLVYAALGTLLVTLVLRRT